MQMLSTTTYGFHLSAAAMPKSGGQKRSVAMLRAINVNRTSRPLEVCSQPMKAVAELLR